MICWIEGSRWYRVVTGMQFTGTDGVGRVIVGRAYLLKEPNWRVRCLDRDWKEFNRRKVVSRAARCWNIQDGGLGFSRRKRAHGGMENRLRGESST